MNAIARWLDKRALLLLHGESLAEHGGLPGLRDAGLLDSALARPLNLAACGMPDSWPHPTASVWRKIIPSSTATSAPHFSLSACFSASMVIASMPPNSMRHKPCCMSLPEKSPKPPSPPGCERILRHVEFH
jgi:hypothetical protein